MASSRAARAAASVEARPAGVLVDATAIPADRGGVGRYLDELVAQLDGPFVIACQARDAVHYRELAPSATVLPQHPRIQSVARRLLWEQLSLPRLARRSGVSVIFSPHYTLPVLSRKKRVVTFHDATFFSDPGVHTPTKGRFFRAWIRLSSRLADAVVVPSIATASELARYIPRDVPRFDVAYHGVDRARFHEPTRAEVEVAATTLGLDGAPWIAFLGTVEPRKNVPSLVAAYRELVADWQSDWGPVPALAIAGGRGWETGLDAEVARTAPPASVHVLGFIDLEIMRGFLGGATVVSYPSLGEGFGLPVLEAMACGAPVLTTRRLALPEVGGDAVAYSEPDSSSISDGLRALVSDPVLRERLATRGIERSKRFSWRESAKTHQAVFARVTNGKV
ncbi:glycosyltransferase family 1 protein [Conyzicola nivalis]|uniref:Glycosyl transferase n=1 Tax=Conyzicola nivalis TaxID=1477021 RepID=A0A916SJS5_9MICO|nr:glycosyltransferase family 1 protein [Conyzicola nivalis]GGB03541.1 glycosyl transferase [Conyzicola nivalis]